MELTLSNGLTALIDDEDYARCINRSEIWHCFDGVTVVTKYAYCWYPYPWQSMLHRFVMDAPEGMEVHHKNHNGLDCRKENLMVLTVSQHRHLTEAKGYHWEASRGKWKAMISVDYKAIYLGRYDNEADAAKAYKDAKKKYFPELFDREDLL